LEVFLPKKKDSRFLAVSPLIFLVGATGFEAATHALKAISTAIFQSGEKF
jgi:hypothetical protein